MNPTPRWPTQSSRSRRLFGISTVGCLILSVMGCASVEVPEGYWKQSNAELKSGIAVLDDGTAVWISRQRGVEGVAVLLGTLDRRGTAEFRNVLGSLDEVGTHAFGWSVSEDGLRLNDGNVDLRFESTGWTSPFPSLLDGPPHP